jgi:hypothetical protein
MAAIDRRLPAAPSSAASCPNGPEIAMPERTTRTNVTFHRPFSMRGVDGVRPPGTYVVESDEELITGLSFDAYRRTATFLFIPSTSGSTTSEVFSIDPADLDAALAQDAAPVVARVPDAPSDRPAAINP